MRQNVTDTELAVLDALWERGPCTVRELTDQLYPGGSTSHYATVGKLLERLESKGCVQRESCDRVKVFAAVVGRSDLITHDLRETADRLCGGSLTPLLTTLVSEARFSREELKTLRGLVEGLDPETASD